VHQDIEVLARITTSYEIVKRLAREGADGRLGAARIEETIERSLAGV